jgi:Ca2+-binding RTX toxin-like protein
MGMLSLVAVACNATENENEGDDLGDIDTDPLPPVLGTVLDDGVLRINVGPFADKTGLPIEADEVVEGTSYENGRVGLKMRGYNQFFTGVTRIVADAGDGDDQISIVGPIPVEFQGGAGNDMLVGSLAADILNGGDGDDELWGAGDADVVDGGADDDFIDGGTGDDILRPGTGTDTLEGYLGSDRLEVGVTELDDTDVFQGGPDADALVILGTGAADHMVLQSQATESESIAAYRIELRDRASEMLLATAIYEFPALITERELENIVLAGLDGDDLIEFGTLTHVHNSSIIEGGAGNDELLGSEFGDEIYGGPGTDILLGLGGSDTLFGGDGDDTLTGAAGNDSLYGNEGNDTLAGGPDFDVLYQDDDSATVIDP